MVLAVPYHLRKLGGRCVSINVLKMDSWRVKNVFKSNNGVSYLHISSYMYKLSDHPKITKGISFESYPSTKKFLLFGKGVKMQMLRYECKCGVKDCRTLGEIEDTTME